VEVQVWPACERNPSVYDRTPSEVAAIEELPLRRAAAAFYEEGARLEISTGLATVIVFGENRKLVLVAVRHLRELNRSAASGEVLPGPAAGAREGGFDVLTTDS
jgi:hypothetical protein